MVRHLRNSMVHLNHHLLVATDCETTGLIPGHHEIIQAAFIPLDQNLEIRKDLPIFDTYIRPNYPNRRDTSIKNTALFEKAMDVGLPGSRAYELFESWFMSLRLPEGKRLMPLGCNYPFDRDFYVEWGGRVSYNSYFDARYRDIQSIAQFWNDRSDFHAYKCPFPDSIKLRDIATMLKIEFIENRLHDAIYDAMITAQCYRRMVLEHPI